MLFLFFSIIFIKMQDLENILKEKFWLESFREWQKEIIESVINWNDTLVFMPTWWWKSLTYQFPWMILEWVAIIISPLISLMKDQVDKLNSLWIRTELINSTISSFEKKMILNELSLNDSENNWSIKFLYIAPERLNDDEFLWVIKNIKISLVAIDEAHCISQWWHDFRPSYLKIKGFLEGLRNPPIPNPFPPGEKGNINVSTISFSLGGKDAWKADRGISSFIENTPDYITKLSQELRKKSTSYEDILWEFLRRKSLNWIKFRRQHPFWRYIADFYSSELNLVIELDWKVHETQIEYDNIRDEIISKYWVIILRIKNEEIDKDINQVLEKISKFPFPVRGGIKGGVSFPLIALTATATKKVRKDITERLWITKYKTFTSWFDRKNLVYIVREISKEQEKLEKVLEIIEKTPPYWIVYCSSVKAVSKVYQYLLWNWIRVGIYTWEMNADLREREQNNFMDSTYDVIVATNAFWMWIDKRDIRYVIHYNLPWSIENYYQEAWRAGRDGKTSYSVIIASYQDTIIQEFFIENTYPPKNDILALYNYLYKGFKIWEWAWTQVLKTYNSIAIEADLKSDMKVWSIIKIFEKYWIVKRWFDARDWEVDFRWRWITLISWKQEEKDIPILWNHQNVLKEESYFKLEQVKKLLFRPGCRKKFILEYFWDEEDLKNLEENCWKCDYCLDKKKYEESDQKEVIPHNVFLIILEFIKRLDDKFWSQILAWILTWSKEKKIIEWNLDNDKDYNILWIYSKEIVVAIFEELTSKWFLYKSFGQFPKIWVSEKWLSAIYNNSILLSENNSLQWWLFMKVKSLTNAISKKENSKSVKIKIEKVDKVDTYTQTLELLNEWKDLKEIAISREMTLQTIETHITKLYEFWKIGLHDIMKYSELDKLKNIKSIIEKNNLELDKLSPIKDLCPWNINYFDIKICLCLIGKGDL